MTSATPAARPQPVSHEELLADYARRLQHHLPGRRAVHLHLSRLSAVNRREHHLRIAATAWELLLKKFDGQLFQLGNNDIVVVTKGASVAEIDQIVLKLRFLFSEDPLAEGSGESADRTFCTWYELAREYPRFVAMAQDMLKRKQAGYVQDIAREAAAQLDKGPAYEAPRQPIDPTRLARLEQGLGSMDLTTMVRRQPVCLVLPNAPPTPVFQEIFVAIAELTKRLMPDVDLASDRWLFQRLTQSLDYRVLSVLPDLEAKERLSSSINLNVATTLSQQFQAFEKKLRFATQKTMVAEFQVVDVFGDVGTFIFARDFLRDRGWRLCLDGLNYLTFPLLAKSELGFDLHKVIWSPELDGEVQEQRRRKFQQTVEAVGADKVVLCRCDTQRAIEFGQSMGIRLFQGRLLDAMLQVAPKAV
ncbi:hypothetical protein [Desertibaculum subflavum]|uniref:hypothetical protein n=1 Tax=Desertibaculum subflavum TaxID=2268458 RepID=UPI000E676007